MTTLVFNYSIVLNLMLNYYSCAYTKGLMTNIYFLSTHHALHLLVVARNCLNCSLGSALFESFWSKGKF